MSDKKRWIVLGSVSLVFALAMGVLIYFQHQKIVERRAEADALRGRIAESRALIAKTPDLVKEVIIQRETDETIKEILSDEEDVNNFVRTLRRFEEDSGVAISSMKQQKDRGKKDKKADFRNVGYTLIFEADAFQLMAFMDKVERHPRFMAITAFKITSARRKGLGDLEIPRHKVQMDLETYVYAPTGAKKEVRIDNYDRKRDLLVSEISKRSASMRAPTYDYHGARGRRDPWMDPRVPVGGPDDAPVLSIEEQIAIVDDLIDRVAVARELWSDAAEADNLIAEMKARADLEEKLALLDEEIRRVEADGQLVFVPANRRFQKNVVSEVAALKEEMTDTTSGNGPSLAALRESAETMQRHIKLAEYEFAIDAYEAIEPRLATAERDAYKRPLVDALHDLKALVTTILEFEAIELQITGISVYEDLRPVALINGHAVSEGELIGDELFVRNIAVDQIEFGYRGLVLARRIESSFNRPQN